MVTRIKIGSYWSLLTSFWLIFWFFYANFVLQIWSSERNVILSIILFFVPGIALSLGTIIGVATKEEVFAAFYNLCFTILYLLLGPSIFGREIYQDPFFVVPALAIVIASITIFIETHFQSKQQN